MTALGLEPVMGHSSKTLRPRKASMKQSPKQNPRLTAQTRKLLGKHYANKISRRETRL